MRQIVPVHEITAQRILTGLFHLTDDKLIRIVTCIDGFLYIRGNLTERNSKHLGNRDVEAFFNGTVAGVDRIVENVAGLFLNPNIIGSRVLRDCAEFCAAEIKFGNVVRDSPADIFFRGFNFCHSGCLFSGCGSRGSSTAVIAGCTGSKSGRTKRQNRQKH